MIKPKIRHGKQCLEKRVSDLECGEFFLRPDTGQLCSVLDLHCNHDTGDLEEVKYYDYGKQTVLYKRSDLEEFVQLVRVEIVYWLAEEKDLFQEKG